jgi:hypothetical protein
MFQTSYGPVRAALAVAFGVPKEVVETAFQGAIANMQKLGLLGSSARIGRGTPLVYTPNEIHRLVCGLELSEVGIPPGTVVALVDAYWPKLKPIFAEASRPLPYPPEQQPGPDEDIVLILDGLALRTGAWSAPKGARFPGVGKIESCRRRQLMDKLAGVTARVIVINLTERLKRFHYAFADEYLKDAIDEEAKAAKQTQFKQTQGRRRISP